MRASADHQGPSSGPARRATSRLRAGLVALRRDEAGVWRNDDDPVGRPRVALVGGARNPGRRHPARVTDPSWLCTYSIDEIPDIVTILGPTGELLHHNAAAQRVLGQDLAARAHDIVGLVHPEDVHILLAAVAELLTTPGEHRTFEFRVRHADGSWVQLHTVGTNLLDDPGARSVVLHSRDVTTQNDARRRLEHARLHDALTGLPARTLFLEHLEQALLRAERLRSTLAVFAVDIDGMSLINERRGFERGDDLLVRIARDLDAVLRADDRAGRSDAVIARFGDAFFVLYEDVAGLTASAAIASRLAEAAREDPEPGARGDIGVSATVGVVLSDVATPDAQTLLVDATSAMEAGKGSGGDRVAFFDEAVRQDAARRMTEVRDLRIAISDGELRLEYQPKVDVATGRLRGVEALVRWDHPRRGTVSPADFIPLAEDSGLILPLGEWVLAEACRQRAAWSPLVDAPGDLVVCVNVSSHQFDATFPDLVRQVLAETRAPYGSLCIEITETALMTDVEGAIMTMHRLRDMGVTISIDDFGTGYSSLAQLKRLPFDEVKIDKSFVDRLGQDIEDTAIVAAIVAMARALRLSVIAEGVETRAQLDQLQALGCELVQGYLFSRPVPPDTIDDLLAGSRLLTPAFDPAPGDVDLRDW